MWFWIIVIAVVIGAIIGYLNEGKGEDALGGAMVGGCMAGGCIVRIALAALGIIIVLWLFGFFVRIMSGDVKVGSTN